MLCLIRTILKDDWRVVEKLAEVGVSPRTRAQIQGGVDAEEVEDVRVAVRNEIEHIYLTSQITDILQTTPFQQNLMHERDKHIFSGFFTYI